MADLIAIGYPDEATPDKAVEAMSKYRKSDLVTPPSGRSALKPAD